MCRRSSTQLPQWEGGAKPYQEVTDRMESKSEKKKARGSRCENQEAGQAEAEVGRTPGGEIEEMQTEEGPAGPAGEVCDEEDVAVDLPSTDETELPSAAGAEHVGPTEMPAGQEGGDHAVEECGTDTTAAAEILPDSDRDEPEARAGTPHSQSRIETPDRTEGAAQMRLLECDDRSEARADVLCEGYLLTNRNNLLEILSTGTIKPLTGYQKYYRDSGTLCPQGIVLLGRPPSAQLVEQWVEASNTQFPVVLTVDLQGMRGPVRVVNGKMAVAEVEAPVADDALAVVMGGVIPLKAVAEVHFRSESEFREYTVRQYSNVPQDVVAMSVSPLLFDGQDVNAEELAAAIEAACRTDGPVVTDDLWTRADALGGALFMLAAVIREAPHLELEMLQYCLEALRIEIASLSEPAPAQDGGAGAHWIALLPQLLLGEDADTRWSSPERIAERVQRSFDENNGAWLIVEAVTLLAAAVHVSQLQPDDQTQDETLEAMHDSIEAAVPVLEAERADEALGRCKELLAAVQAVGDLTLDVQEFPADESASMTGLLRFLLEPAPAAIIHLVKNGTVQPDESVAVAAVLSGALYGRSRMPLEYHPSAALREYIDGCVVQGVNRLARGPAWRAVGPQPSVRVQMGDEEEIELLLAGETRLMERQIAPKPTEPVETEGTGGIGAIDEKPSRATFEAEVTCEERAAAREDLLTSDLTQQMEHEAALLLCQEAGWTDCLTTVVPLEGSTFVLTNHGGEMELRIKGVLAAEVRHEVQTRPFRRRIGSADWDALPTDKKDQVVHMLRNASATELDIEFVRR